MLQTSDSLNDTADCVSRLRIGMGTIVAISAEAHTAQSALCGIEAAFAAIDQVDRLMHPTRIGGDLVAIHQGKLGAPVAVHAWTWEVLALSRHMNQISHGAFDPCLPGAQGGFADLQLVPPQSVILHRSLRIDLGGIAKGYAIDRALDALRAVGCRSGLVNAGGDLAVFGDRSYPVVIRGQCAAGSMVELKNSALASSDVCSSARPAEHRGYYHGVTRREIGSGRVSVSAPRAAIADALTKCLLADPGPASVALLETFDARLIVCEVSP